MFLRHKICDDMCNRIFYFIKYVVDLFLLVMDRFVSCAQCFYKFLLLKLNCLSFYAKDIVSFPFL